jgi:amino-acid N-acetyltransferase
MVHSHHDEGRRSPDGRGVRLRGAAPGDLDRARSLVSGLGLPVEGLGDQFLQGYVVAVTGDGALVGVALSCQGSSIGRAIVEDRIEWARGRGLASLYLLTETAPGFFERLGFERVERASLPKAVQASSEFSRVCPDTAVAMALALG